MSDSAALVALEARLDDMSTLDESGKRYSHTAGDYLADLAADAIDALRAALAAADRAERGLPLDVERLARAIESVFGAMADYDADWKPGAAKVAAEYCRLAADPQSPEPVAE